MRRTAINLRLPADLLTRVDAEAERLGQTRTKFVERALEAALTGAHDSPAVASPGVSRSSAAKRNVKPIPKRM
jgi:predicted DNA-binding protein